MKRLLLTLLLLLTVCSGAWAADTKLCSDDDNNGVIDIIKSSGKPDRDCDGELSVTDGGTDCDDTTPFIHNGSYTISGCTSAYRYCDAGVYKSGPGGSTAVANGGQGCVTSNLTPKGTNYYLSPTGSGTTCSAASPCLPSGLSGKVTGGDTAVIVTGTGDFGTSENLQITASGTSSGSRNYLIKDPRSTAKFNTTSSCAAPCSTVKITGDNWIVQGLEITGGDPTSSGGLRLDGSNQLAFNNWVHDAKGANANNVAGIYLKDGGSAIEVKTNIVSNTQDSSLTLQAGVRQNVWNISGFVGENLDIHNNFVGYNHAVNTAPYEVQGGGIRYKHGADPAGITLRSYIRRNVVWNTEYTGTVTEGDKRWVYGNLILGSSGCGADAVASNGSFTYYTDRRWYNNTCVTAAHFYGGTNTNQAYNVLANSGSTALNGSSAGGLIVSGNVIDDSAQTTYGGGNFLGMFGLQPYGPDANYTAFITNRVLESSNNCFYNSAIAGLTSGFPVFADNGSTSSGATVNFANWKLSPYLQDVASTNANPTLNSNYEVTANCPTTIGWAAEWPTVSSSASARKGQENGSGRKGQK